MLILCCRLVFTSNMLHLYSVLNPILTGYTLLLFEPSLNPSRFQTQPSYILLRVSGVLGIMACKASITVIRFKTDKRKVAKISNASSRPWSFFLAAVLCTSGLAVAAGSDTPGSYAIGMVMIGSGKDGLLLTATVIISDSSDLRWRTLCIWALHFTVTIWHYLSSDIERLFYLREINSKIRSVVPAMLYLRALLTVAPFTGERFFGACLGQSLPR